MNAVPSLSIATGIINRFLRGEVSVDALKQLRESGFTHIHLTYKWNSPEAITPRELDALRCGLDEARLEVLDIHGPHPVVRGEYLDITAEDPADRQLAFDHFRQSLALAHVLGADAMAYHVPTRPFAVPVLERYLDGLRRLEAEARDLGVVVALENHFNAETDRRVLSRCFEEFSADYIGFTFDTGHACLSGNSDWIMKNCMDRLRILHLNDNDAKSDRHWVPCQPGGRVDWDAVARAIASSPYHKPVQLEVLWREEKHAAHSDFVRDAAASALRLHEQIGVRRYSASNRSVGRHDKNAF